MADKNVKRKLIVIEDGLLSTMAASTAYTNEFPFLKALASVKNRTSGCGKCGRGNQEQAAVFRAAKAAIAGLSSDRKRKLKELMRAERIRVRYINSSQKQIELTF